MGGGNEHGACELDVPVEVRECGRLRALLFFIGPFVPGIAVFLGLNVLISLRAQARGREASVILVAVVAVVGVAWLVWYSVQSSRRYRGRRICLVAAPREVLAQFTGFVAVSPLHVVDGKVMITSRGREYGLRGVVDRIVIGARARRCCFVEFHANGQVSRSQALGRLPTKQE